MKAPSLKTTFYRFGEYYRKFDKERADFNRNLASEGRKRLKQIEFVLERVAILENESKKFMEMVFKSKKASPKIPRKEVLRHSVMEDEKELLTESFYYIAFRLRKIIRSLPALGNFECKEVRDVRNKLIEHAEESGVFFNSFASGGPNGPVIKASRMRGQEDIFPDKGLYHNASKFINNLNNKLQHAI